jgi:sigma-B regulation protein RsbU (phosphoserine phosphatase)
MHENDSLFPMADSHGRLECKEIWGGIRNQDSEVSAGKIIGSIYSAPCCQGGRGGDIYYFGVCKDGIISRLAIADVTGHGEEVSEISQYVYESLKAHI